MRPAQYLSSASLLALAVVLAPGKASAAECAGAPTNAIALGGVNCDALRSTYNPPSSISVPGLPVSYTGFAFFAEAGSSITANSSLSIDTSVANSFNNAYGVWSNGSGANVNLNGAATITTKTANSYGLYASGGGAITAYSPAISVSANATPGTLAEAGSTITLNGGSVASSGAGGIGVKATGSGAAISADSVSVSAGLTNTTNATGLVADKAASLTFVGGDVTVSGDQATGASATGGASLSLNENSDTHLGPTFTVGGNGSIGLVVHDSSSRLTGEGVTVTMSGSSTVPGIAGAASNSNFGTLELTDSTLTSKGAQAYGVKTTSGGTTTLTNTSVIVTGDSAFAGVASGPQGSTSIFGGSISTTRDNSIALYASGSGATVSTDVYVDSDVKYGTQIMTGGFNSAGVQADLGGSAILNSADVTTTGQQAFGIYATGSGSQISATDVFVNTTGDSASGLLADSGASAMFSGGSITTGGKSAFGAGAFGAETNVTITGPTSILTKGNGSAGLVVSGAGASLAATNASVTTQGGVNSNDGLVAFGAYNGDYAGFTSGGEMTLTDVVVNTSGGSASGIVTNSGGQTTVTGGSVTTGADFALGLWASGSLSKISKITATNLTVETDGAEAAGVLADTGASIGFTGGSITVKGLLAPGIEALDGGSVTVSGGPVTAKGDGSQGLLVSGSGSSIIASNTTILSTGGYDSADGVASGAARNEGGALAIADSHVTSTGAQGYGVYTDSAGTTTLTRDTILVSGDYAFAGVASLSGGQTTIDGGSVSTSGADTIGLLASGTGSSITTKNATSVSTSGSYSHGVQADGGGSVTLGGGSVSVTGSGSLGLYSTGTDSAITATDVAVSAGEAASDAVLAEDGGSVSASGGSISASANDAFAVRVVGGSADISNAMMSASGDNGGGLYNTGYVSLEEARADLAIAATTAIATAPFVTAHLTNVATTVTGANSYGVLTDSGGGTSISGGSTTVTGDDSYGVVSIGGSATSLNETNVSVTGLGSKGLFVAGAGSSLTATDSSISTSGERDEENDLNPIGAYNGAGFGYSEGGSLKLTDTSVSTIGFHGDGVVTSDQGVTTIAGGSISTEGNSAYAVVSQSGGKTTLSGTTISTKGDGSGGLAVNGAGSEIDATGVTISTTGGYDALSGQHSYGAYNGPFGGFTSGGILNLTDVGITTQGHEMHGVLTGAGGVTTILGGSIGTTGDGAIGVFATDGASVNVGASSLGGTAISTEGHDAAGVSAVSGAKISLTGSTVTTLNDGSPGISIIGVGSEVDATNASVTTQGGEDTKSGRGSYGVYNGPFDSVSSGGVAKLTDTSVVTHGDQMYAVFTTTGGVTTISGGAMTTSGVGASGVVTTDGGSTAMSGAAVTTNGPDAVALTVVGSGSTVSLSGTNTLTTHGDGGIGVYAANGGVVSAPSGQTNISTSGGVSAATSLGAYGVFADGAGGDIQLAGANITTLGDEATGLYASISQSQALTGGSIVVAGPLSVTTSGFGAYGAWAQNPGSTIDLQGPSTFTINGSAFALNATEGGAITASDSVSITVNGSGGGGVQVADPGSAVTLKGPTSVTLNGFGNFGLLAADGGALSLQGPTNVAVNGGGSAGVVASSAAITASGALNLTTSQATSHGFVLSGTSPSITATGGGTVSTAGSALTFLDATNAVATFDNFTFNGISGDLIFADPSTATVNFNNTTANAGANNLLNATQGSAFTLNASASNLTGAIQTDATSVTNVNLASGSLWTMTGSSFVSNLVVTNSGVVFAPPGASGFKTLTVNNWIGTGASLTMNAQLGGANSTADLLIINGGKATGSTALTINNAGGLGGQTTGNGILLISAVNGGSIASNAFGLTNTPVVNGYRYTLTESSDAWYLVSSPTSTQADIVTSLSNFARTQQQQIITNRILSSILLGATEQINCSNCSSGFGSIGSYSVGAHGRWSLTDQLTFIGGFSYGGYSADGVEVNNAPMFAGALVYDFVNWGRSRPFLEAGVGVTPYSEATYTRTYLNGDTVSSGWGKTINRNAAIFGRVGWVARLTPIDEAAVYTDLSRNWLKTGGYSEVMTPANPYPMSLDSGTDALNIARLGAQWTHLFFGNLEANVSAAVAYGFSPTFGSEVNVIDFAGAQPYPTKNSTWLEYGARLGYRVGGGRMVIDGFILGTAGGEVGSTIHGGLGLRYLF